MKRQTLHVEVKVRPGLHTMEEMQEAAAGLTDEELADYARYHPTLTDTIGQIQRARRETRDG
jgi:hypothetical protein